MEIGQETEDRILRQVGQRHVRVVCNLSQRIMEPFQLGFRIEGNHGLHSLGAGRIKWLTEMLMACPGAQEDRTRCSLEMGA